MTFVRGGGESEVLAAFGADPRDELARITARSAPASAGPAGLPLVLLRRSGDWLVALEQNIPPQGARPEVLRNVSAATEAVMLYQDVGKLYHEFAHAFDGEVVSAVRTLWPPHWWGSDPDRLRPLAQELGLASDAGEGSDLTGLEVLLALGEGVFGLSLEEADLDQPWLAAPILPVLADLPAGPQPGQPPRTGDPVIDLYLAHITDEDLRSVLARRVSRLIAATSLDEYRELAGRVQGALAVRTQQASDDDPVQLTLRQLAWDRETAELHPAAAGSSAPAAAGESQRRIRRGEAAWLLRFVLAGRHREALAEEIKLQRRWQEPGWRQQAIADLADVQVPAAELRAAEEAWQAQQAAPSVIGVVDAGPVASHVQRLIAAGVSPEDIATRAGMTTIGIDLLVRGVMPDITARTAHQLLAINVP
ncbi:MAG TPA: DUF6461 domain-containing protein [Streptosporangiaceae bacterium]